MNKTKPWHHFQHEPPQHHGVCDERDISLSRYLDATDQRPLIDQLLDAQQRVREAKQEEAYRKGQRRCANRQPSQPRHSP